MIDKQEVRRLTLEIEDRINTIQGLVEGEEGQCDPLYDKAHMHLVMLAAASGFLIKTCSDNPSN